MKSKKNLTRFTYENSAFEGWRLCISRAGTTFMRYFPDKKLGGPKKSLTAAEKALAEVLLPLPCVCQKTPAFFDPGTTSLP